MKEPVRTFICIEIPETIKQRIERLQATIKTAGAQVSWTKPSNIHLTLKFLGDVAASRIKEVEAAVRLAAGQVTEFEIEVGGAGCFPNTRNPRVLWVGLIALPEALSRLQRLMEDELEAKGFPRDSKRFSPHLTIGRVRSPERAREAVERLIAEGFEAERFVAHEVIVMRSDLKPTGSVYTPQASIRL
ncbi:MAG TPA: RNA 2',3'-cyclic phosphodiesterase [Blastocatellia bacterium]|jgi:2'-5' RNA ligase